MRWAACLVLALLCGLGTSPSDGTEIRQDARVARGEHIARTVCSACHAVAKDQEFPPLLAKPAPSFVDIANREGTTAVSVRKFITTTHWDFESIPMTMPDPMLTADDATAVVRYILSLRSR